jgi:hypothetical protein
MGRPSFVLFLGLCVAGSGLAGCAPSDNALTLSGGGGAGGMAPMTSLLGATPASLTASLGVPALRRVDGPAQVWLYHSPTCGLNLILYPDAGGTPRVADAVPDNGNEAACLSSLTARDTRVAMEHLPAS